MFVNVEDIYYEKLRQVVVDGKSSKIKVVFVTTSLFTYIPKALSDVRTLRARGCIDGAV